MPAQRATLKPYLAEIREWVAQGYTDVWIAHTLNSTPSSISSFRSENGILRRDVAGETTGADVPPPVLPADAEEPAAGRKPKRRRRTRKRRAGGGRRRARQPSRRTATASRAASAGAAVAGGRKRGAGAAAHLRGRARPRRRGLRLLARRRRPRRPACSPSTGPAAAALVVRSRPTRSSSAPTTATLTGWTPAVDPAVQSVVALARRRGRTGEGRVLHDREVVRPDLVGGALGDVPAPGGRCSSYTSLSSRQGERLAHAPLAARRRSRSTTRRSTRSRGGRQSSSSSSAAGPPPTPSSPPRPRGCSRAAAPAVREQRRGLVRDPLAERVAGLGQRERDVRVQALDGARRGRCPPMPSARLAPPSTIRAAGRRSARCRSRARAVASRSTAIGADPAPRSGRRRPSSSSADTRATACGQVR